MGYDDYDPDFEIIDEGVIEERLNSLHIPITDEYFADSKNLPFCVYLTPSAHYSGADGINTQREQMFRIELYTKSKKSPLRQKLFDLFNDVEFDVEEESGGQKNYYLTAIEFSSLLDLDSEYEDEE